MAEKIDGLVVEVLDTYRVALNLGASQGVKAGDDVVVWRLVNLKDPATGEELGTVRLDNLKMRVTLVEAKYSVASVHAQSQLFGSNLAIFGPRKRIQNGPKASDETVIVRTGDEVTVTLSDPEE